MAGQAQEPRAPGPDGALRWAPGTSRAVRGPHALQVGSGVGAVVLEHLTAADWTVVARLDRGELRVSGARERALVDPLRTRGLVVPAAGTAPGPVAANPRTGPAVAVVGGRGLGVLLCAALAGAGAGTAALVDDSTVGPADVLPGGATAADVGRRAVHAAAEAVHRVSPDARTACPTVPDLVVLVADGAHDAPAGSPLVQAGTVHLPVLRRDDGVRVGPLVVPGLGPCLHCLDLLHRDVDPGWPAVVRALLHDARSTATAPPPPATSLAVAAAALTLALRTDLGRSRSAGAVAGAAAVVDRWGDLTWQRWPSHPDCGCTGLPDTDPWDGA
ncbi:ThiF family adenylyltransferase [Aquipuribacter sp. SD81]|uniref:ThiF family adenylyltransferase n=1 Tax=Aquipuribacter sp. SD81 TaxID=3127703 RepID=UPI00301A539A